MADAAISDTGPMVRPTPAGSAMRAGSRDGFAPCALVAATSLALALGLAWLASLVFARTGIGIATGVAGAIWSAAFALVAMRAFAGAVSSLARR